MTPIYERMILGVFMKAIDFKKDPVYKAKTEPEIVTIPRMLFVMVDGQGDPDGKDFQDAMQAIYGIVYTIKFWDKKFEAPEGYEKFTMAPLEGLWWMKNDELWDVNRRNDWCWTAMVRLPEFVDDKYFNEVIDTCIKQKKSDVYKKARLEYFNEGQCVQILHIGPYSTEGPNIQKMHQFAADQGYKLRGKHHELYFGDPRRTAPEKLKTILRQPVEK
ncbi:MAG: GyrI-like domain-containing protein [Thiobacillus sp.]